MEKPIRADGKPDLILTLKLPALSAVIVKGELEKRIEHYEARLDAIKAAQRLPPLTAGVELDLEKERDLVYSGLYYLKVAYEGLKLITEGLKPEDV